MAFKMGACKGCNERREAIAKAAENVKHYVAKYTAKKAKESK